MNGEQEGHTPRALLYHRPEHEEPQTPITSKTEGEEWMKPRPAHLEGGSQCLLLPLGPQTALQPPQAPRPVHLLPPGLEGSGQQLAICLDCQLAQHGTGMPVRCCHLLPAMERCSKLPLLHIARQHGSRLQASHIGVYAEIKAAGCIGQDTNTLFSCWYWHATERSSELSPRAPAACQLRALPRQRRPWPASSPAPMPGELAIPLASS